MTSLLACADIRIDGTRPWDIQVHDRHFFNRVLASGTLGFGESYMDGWWDCDALDEMSCRAIHAGLENRFALRLPNVWALLTALVANQQTLRRSRKVGRVHYDLSNDFFEAMLDPNMQYSCALFAEGDDPPPRNCGSWIGFARDCVCDPACACWTLAAAGVDWPVMPPAITVAT